MPTDTYCVLPWQSLSIDNQGRSRICCNNDAHYRSHDGVRINDCGTASEAMHTDYHRQVRAALANGEQHASCSKCWDMERRGGRSFREIWNSILPDVVKTPTVRYLDVTLGNKCNLTCRMCNEWNSHLWQIDNQRMGRRSDPNISNTRWFEASNVRKLISDNLSTVTHINFLGGEPLIVPEQLELLRSCLNSGRAHEISLSYNTNMTTLLGSQLELWRGFKRVDLSVSLEGVGIHNDYIRQNSRWADIERNIYAVLGNANVHMTVHATFGMLNALTVCELARWATEHSAFGGRLPWLNIVHWPANQDPRHLPDCAKTLVRERLLGAVRDLEADPSYASWISAARHLDQRSDSAQWHSFWSDADQLDAYKHTDIGLSLPELASYRP